MNRTDSSRVPELDGLRGIAIALVLWKHLVNPYLPLGFAHPLAWLGALGGSAWIGVDLFFVLSGYFIGGILIDRRDSPNLAPVFYARRALRILPLFYLTLAVCAAGSAAGWVHAIFPAWTYPLFLSNLMLALGNEWDAPMLSLLWSIAVEEQFYLAAPWVMRAVPVARLPVLFGGLIALAVVLRMVFVLAWPEYSLARHTLTPLRMDLLAAGALVAWLLRSGRGHAAVQWLGRRWVGVVAAIAALLGVLASNRALIGAPSLAWYGYSLITLCFATLVLLVAGARPPGLCRLLAWPPLVHLGRHSYFVYLWHMLIGFTLINAVGGPGLVLDSPRSVLVIALGIAATWAAAAVSWRYFEGPLVTLGHRLHYRT